MTNIKKIAVLTSGGDAPGMNAAIRSVVRTCVYHNVEVLGVYRGYQGMIENDFTPLDARSVRNLINRGGTFLKSARSKDFRTPEGRKKAYENLVAAGADALVVIGGDGSFTGALLFNQEFGFPVMGIPGTIDNDIYGTTYTLGYDTALNTVVEAIDKIRDTASSHNRMFFIEVMGRDAGFLALNSGIGGGAEKILIPEQHSTLEELVSEIEVNHNKGKMSNIIVVAEGDTTGKNVFELKKYVENGYDKLPICISKTQKSLSDNPNLLGRPTGFTITINEVRLSAGAGFLVAMAGEIIDMPGLPRKPAAELIDIDENGVISGLF